jgi:hypothetical protein
MPTTERSSPFDPVIVPAFDHLDMSIGTMWKMSHYIPILERNVSETLEDDVDDDELDSQNIESLEAVIEDAAGPKPNITERLNSYKMTV